MEEHVRDERLCHKALGGKMGLEVSREQVTRTTRAQPLAFHSGGGNQSREGFTAVVYGRIFIFRRKLTRPVGVHVFLL